VDYRLLYTKRSLNDLADIFGRAGAEDAAAASRFGKGLLDHVELLARFPRMGAVTRKRPPVRKLAHSPILVYYQIHENQHLIKILHFRHGARKAPTSELQSELPLM
jgi:plasmid stabilization system protein ParE